MSTNPQNDDAGAQPGAGGRESPNPDPNKKSEWILVLGFFALAALLFAMPRHAPVPLAPQSKVDRAELVPSPRRNAMADPAGIMVEGASQNCNACHQIFKSNPTAASAVNFHKSIVLQHGLNNRCVNCHDVNDRELLTLRDGATVPFSQTPMLCAQCHGTVFRDWERGTHGKTMGSWKTQSPEQHRLTCNQCHDPHSPKYEPYIPLPGPNTLRMGEQDSDHALEGKQSPLQRWLSRSNGAESHRDAPAPHLENPGEKP